MNRRCFTLIESLAVVALLAIAMGTLAASVAPSVEIARLREARSAVLGVDARARSLAMRGRPIVLLVGKGAVSAFEPSDPQATPLVHRPLPDGVAVSIQGAAGDETLRTIRINTDGRSADYRIRIVSGAHAAETVVAGLTGYAFDPREARTGGDP